MSSNTATTPLNIGFLTVLHENGGYLGGYLVTNQWGRPLEFRLSTAVQPNRVQQILYGGSLRPYICADLIGKTLVDKTGVPAQMVLTDTEAVLDLRLRLDAPVAWIAPLDTIPGPNVCLCSKRSSQGSVFCHSLFPNDVSSIREILDRFDGALDIMEPFARIREAIGEARKMGVTSKAAG